MNIAKQLLKFLFLCVEEDIDLEDEILIEQDQMQDYGALGYYLEKELKLLPQVKSFTMTQALTQSDPSGFSLELFSDRGVFVVLDISFFTDEDEELDVQFRIRFDDNAEAREIECNKTFYQGEKRIFKIQL